MGAWGTGPFESDAGLDLLDKLAGLKETPGPEKQGAIYGELSALLASAQREETPGRYYDHASMYAAAALVTFSLGAVETHRLWPGFTPPEEYFGLLAPETAKELVATARNAVQILSENQAWLRTWRHRLGIATQLERLGALLTAVSPAASS